MWISPEPTGSQEQLAASWLCISPGTAAFNSSTEHTGIIYKNYSQWHFQHQAPVWATLIKRVCVCWRRSLMTVLFDAHIITSAQTKQQEENKFWVNESWTEKLTIRLGRHHHSQSNLYFLLYFSLVQYHEIPAILSAELYLSTEAYTIASNSRAKLARPF